MCHLKINMPHNYLIIIFFYEFELSVLLKDSMSTSKRPRLSRDALLHATLNLKDSLHTLKMRVQRDERNSRWTQVALVILGLAAVAWLGLESLHRGKVAKSAPDKAAPPQE